MRRLFQSLVAVAVSLVASGVGQAQTPQNRTIQAVSPFKTASKAAGLLPVQPQPLPFPDSRSFETPAARKQAADAVAKSPPAADADLSVLRVTARSEGGKV